MGKRLRQRHISNDKVWCYEKSVSFYIKKKGNVLIGYLVNGCLMTNKQFVHEKHPNMQSLYFYNTSIEYSYYGFNCPLEPMHAMINYFNTNNNVLAIIQFCSVRYVIIFFVRCEIFPKKSSLFFYDCPVH